MGAKRREMTLGGDAARESTVTKLSVTSDPRSFAEAAGGGSDRITVMRIIDRLNVGGPAIHAVLATKGLDPHRFRTVLVIGQIEPGEADMGYLLKQHGVENVIVIPSLGRELRPVRDLWTAWKLYQTIRRERPLVVHTHKAKAGAIGRLVALASGVPVRVHTFHGHVLRGYFGPGKSALFAALERGLAKISSRLITPSARLADELATAFRVSSRDHFAVISLGFDLEPFATSDVHHGCLRRELAVDSGAKLVAIVGRMVPVKAHRTFVEAAHLVTQRRSDVRFLFVGGGELEAQVRWDVHRLGLADRAHFLGWRRDLPLIYADLDVSVLSSLNEGTPVSLIEAMACGIPVVSTDVGGVADVFRHGARGELVPPSDPRALADAIDRALSDEAKARALAIRTEIVNEFGAARLCRELGELYLELLPKWPSLTATVRGESK
jgi:glycosyltransferase involved in cell wall biosynthesis